MDKHKFGFLIIILFSILLVSCTSSGPILIGVSGELSGVRGELGIAMRNGVLLAVEEINAAGGINGRPIELIIKDDTGDPNRAVEVDKELIAAGVPAIIGHVTSGQTAAVMDLINQNDVLLISASASGTEFSKKDDNFLRVIVAADLLSTSLASHMIDKNDFSEVTVIYSTGNDPFVFPFIEGFGNVFSTQGSAAEILPIECENTACEPEEIQRFVEALAEKKPEVILAVTSAYDLALFVQYAEQQNYKPKIFSSTWAGTNELIEKGGAAADGIELVAAYHPDYPSEEFAQFKVQYEERFGKEPSLLAANGYTAMKILGEALKLTNGEFEGLKEAYLSVEPCGCIQGEVALDAFGDASREIFIAEIIDGKFLITDSIFLEK